MLFMERELRRLERSVFGYSMLGMAVHLFPFLVLHVVLIWLSTQPQIRSYILDALVSVAYYYIDVLFINHVDNSQS